MTGTQAAWTCPSCQRTGPARVDSCYCGTDRETADRFRARELGARRGGPPWSAIGLALAAAVVVALAFSAPTRLPNRSRLRRSSLQPGTQRNILRKHELDPAHRGRMRSEIESALR